MLKRRDFLAGAAGGLFSLALRGSAKTGKPTNFVLIFTDDQGYGDLGCFGARGFETPHLDQLARQGMRFTNFHTAQAVCSASRASLLTGCYPNRIGIRGALGPSAQVGLNPEEQTIAELLKTRGYTCGIFGKWHLGHHREFLPLRQGFDEYLGLPYSNDMWPVGYDGKPLAGNPDPKPARAGFPPLPLIDGEKEIAQIWSLEDQNTLTTRYTERAVQFIEKNQDRPFFLYVPHSMPHVPLGVSSKFKGRSKQGMYGDVIMEIDWSVGEILAALRKNGLEENTLVVFASDNGPWLNFGNHAGSAGPLREGKGTSWEGGKRVPCIMRWPGVIPANSLCDQLSATLDILPTFAGIAGASLPDRKIDGVNILSLLKRERGENPRDHMVFYYPQGGDYDQLQAVYDGRWKLHLPHPYRSYLGVEPGRDGFAGPYSEAETGLALFDLKEDIGESRDVKDQHPEIVARLLALAEAAREELGDKDRPGKGARAPGRVSSAG
jgi:arylsulfatase A-like enzyme